MNRILLTVLCLKLISARTIFDDYEKNRTYILNSEAAHSIGCSLKMTEDEKIVNNILMDFKNQEYMDSFYHSDRFNFSKHYFTYKDYIQNSKVYQIIRKMPKGAALHIHSTFMLDGDYLLTLTYEDYLYACYTDNDLKLYFSYTAPQRPCTVKWTLLSEMRTASDNITAFDLEIKKFLTLYSTNPKDLNADLNTVWNKFDSLHKTIKGLILYRPVREKFIYESLRRLYDDNVMYVEMRSGLQKLYELNGTLHDLEYFIMLHKEVTQKFIEENPDFIGMKIILTKHRGVEVNVMKDVINTAKKFKLQYPDMVAGFDLVGQEDAGKPLKDFLPLLMEVKNDLNFYFHGGETNWFGTTTDENLIDAILLGTKRIGHGTALSKHPMLMSMVKKQDIAIEVNVISNAVLTLVRDVRNHPLSAFLSFGLPIVLSSDDPGVWGAEPLSHDFYVAFIAVASKKADLRLLKQLAINSIKYSALEKKTKSYKVFNKRWNEFLKNIIAEYRGNGD